ncbi:NAD(P)/FAD-dependent oxidoreductase [Arthrobacter sp. KNU-44]|uniref:NAD(P)/FAD-dependent oxidoreductase n=1 Tax=Arthrobacter sp. KNU-44 TaxID=3450744 RepID=UPI003F43F6B7
MTSFDVLIVGGGHAGVQTAVLLNAAGYAGSVGLVGDESAAPYERPPLTKGYLSSGIPVEDLSFRTDDWWAGSGIHRILGRRVESVDAAAHTVCLDDGRTIGYRMMVWAAGGEARRLRVPGADLEGVMVVRKLDDADKLKRALAGARKAVVIGGGYIGLESAASLRTLGLEVTVVEALDRLLARVTGNEVAEYVRAQHERAGVEIILCDGISEIVGMDGHATGVVLTSGLMLEADIVLVGIGLIPNIEALALAGAEVGNGVLVDRLCRTSLPDVFAIGDCASFPSRFTPDDRLRLESVQNANDQAKVVAGVITGAPQEYNAVPWFWSHQYDDKLQTAGILAGYDATVVRGDPASGKFSVIYLRGDTVAAVDAINNTRDYAQGKRLIGVTVSADRASLADRTVALKSFAELGTP